MAAIASMTGCNSVGDFEMTPSTSEVAVWYSRLSVSFLRPRLHLLEQPGIVDRDHGLVGEGGNELDLAIAEWLDLGTPERNDADRLAVAQQRHGQHGRLRYSASTCFWLPRSGSTEASCTWIARFSSEARPASEARPGGDRIVSEISHDLRTDADMGREIEFVAAQAPDRRPLRRTEALCGFNDGVEHRLQLVG